MSQVCVKGNQTMAWEGEGGGREAEDDESGNFMGLPHPLGCYDGVKGGGCVSGGRWRVASSCLEGGGGVGRCSLFFRAPSQAVRSLATLWVGIGFFYCSRKEIEVPPVIKFA